MLYDIAVMSAKLMGGLLLFLVLRAIQMHFRCKAKIQRLTA